MLISKRDRYEEMAELIYLMEQYDLEQRRKEKQLFAMLKPSTKKARRLEYRKWKLNYKTKYEKEDLSDLPF